MTPEYIHLPSGGTLPVLEKRPFRAVVVIQDAVSDDWRNKVSRWLVDGGCLFMMAWGQDCSRWDDSVDWANLEDFDYKDIPYDRYVLTTWHEDEPLSEVFWFAAHCATHDAVELRATVILDISQVPREHEILTLYADAATGTDTSTV